MRFNYGIDPYKIIYELKFKKEIIRFLKNLKPELFSKAPYEFLKNYDNYYKELEYAKDVENVVVCGTGANALYMDMMKKFTKKKLIILDSPSPYILEEIFKLNKEKTAIVYISRSGDTLEVISAYHMLHNKFKHNIVLANKGKLKLLALENKDKIIDIRTDLSGRYMFATNIVSIPCYLLGINFKDLLLNAIQAMDLFFKYDIEEFKDIDEKNFNQKLKEIDNPALNITILIYYFSQTEKIDNIWVTSYDYFLQELPNIFNQLVNESTGKEGSRILLFHKNSPRAQHELIQRVNGGDKNIFPIILTTQKSLIDYEFEDGIGLKGRTANDIINIEAKATMKAYEKLNIGYVNINLDNPTLKEVVKTFILSQCLAYYLSKLLRVNPFDNPDVDLGKEYAREALHHK